MNTRELPQEKGKVIKFYIPKIKPPCKLKHGDF